MPKKNRKKQLKHFRRRTAAAYLFTLPSFIGFMVFVLIPVVWVFVISFQKYNVFSQSSVFVGLENYKNVLTDARSLEALKNTLWYTVFCALGNTALGVLLAVLVNDILPRKLSIFFRSAYFFPSLIGLTFVAIIWKAFFQTDAGVINYYLSQIGIAKIGWLSSKSISKISVLILDVWKNAGMSMLLILAGLQNVPSELMEVASIDGAGPMTKFWKITIPLASPQIFFVLIMNLTGALRIYESILVLTNGGPGDSSRSLVMLIAEKGFKSFNYGEASAISMLLFLMIAVITAVQFLGSKKWVFYE